MLFDIAITPRQIKALAGWIQDGELMAEVELAVDDRMLVAQQADEVMAWDTGGEPASETYLAVAPLCEHPDCERQEPHARHPVEPAKHSALPEPPAHLADAWARYQRGEIVEGWELSELDEWRVTCAQEAGY